MPSQITGISIVCSTICKSKKTLKLNILLTALQNWQTKDIGIATPLLETT